MGIPRKVRILDWLMPYDDATQNVTVEITVSDILNGIPGSDTDCMGARCIQAQRNEHLFPHDVIMVSVTLTRVFIVDKLNENGEPAHAVRYEIQNRDRRMIALHDRYGIGEPKALRLKIPRDPKGSPIRGASDQRGRFGETSGRYSGSGENTGKTTRPVAQHSIRANGRLVIAVGAGLREPPIKKPKQS